MRLTIFCHVGRRPSLAGPNAAKIRRPLWRHTGGQKLGPRSWPAKT
ncbi:hypothetical protein BpHYR1_035770 [Brachionus plicatilis]|uniref:Uncharacterized protein n=1 Tax=Brachionus plicatilis TaxID=10195 RepID=A0A3M7PSE2_BRAPC|nr:hypothetical protein BpHYR1_035770 [Brachionus plicatilis]